VDEYKVELMIMSGVDDGKLLSFQALNGDGALTPAPDSEDLVWTLQIGRSESMDVCLRYDTFSSRQHARLIFKNGGWYLEDCQSKNGTFIIAEDLLDDTLGGDLEVDETQVTSAVPLAPGQLFRVGRTWMRIHPTAAAESD
jgi:predicted component of type VI protein secretion system